MDHFHRYWTETSLQLRLIQGVFSNAPLTFSLSWDHFRSDLFNSRLFTNKSGVPGADIDREGWVGIGMSTAGDSVKAIVKFRFFVVAVVTSNQWVRIVERTALNDTYNRELKQRRRGRLVKNTFIFYQRNSKLSRSVQ